MRYSKPLYGILGIYIPLSLLALWAPLPGMVYGRFFSGQAPLPAPSGLNETIWCITGFLSALAASFYVSAVKNSPQGHKAADFRGSILAVLAAYTILSLSRGGIPLGRRFIPSVNSAASALAALFTWVSVISLREIFGGLELFESLTAECRGERLREVMREYAPEMSQTDGKLKKLAGSYGIGFILPCLLMNAGIFSRRSLPLTVFTLAAFSAGFLLLGFLRLLRRELACASEGISVGARDRSLPLPVMALGIGIAALLALAGSSEASLLPPGIILVFFSWFAKLFSFLFRPPDKTEPAFPKMEPMFRPENPAGLFPEMEETGPWPGWKWVKICVIVLAAFLFLLFMIHPLLRRSGFSFKAGKLRAALIRWFGDFRKGISAFFSALGERGTSLKIKKIDEEKLKAIAAELFSGARRRELRRSVNLFARLILWGVETAGVPWKPALAPGEYCGLLAAALLEKRGFSAAGDSGPDNSAGAVLRSGELFEKALYSGRRLSAGEEDEYKTMIRSVTGIHHD